MTKLDIDYSLSFQTDKVGIRSFGDFRVPKKEISTETARRKTISRSITRSRRPPVPRPGRPGEPNRRETSKKYARYFYFIGGLSPRNRPKPCQNIPKSVEFDHVSGKMLVNVGVWGLSSRPQGTPIEHRNEFKI